MIQRITPDAIPDRDDRRLKQARLLCQHAGNRASWLIANRLASDWCDGGCAVLGFPSPPETDTRHRGRRVQYITVFAKMIRRICQKW